MHIKSGTVLLAFKFAIQFGYALGQQTSLFAGVQSIITSKFSQFVENVREQEGVPGLALGVFHNGRSEYDAWGVKSEDGQYATADTLFGIASCSKAFASTALGILMDDFAHGTNVTALPPSVLHFDWLTKITDLLPDEWLLMDQWATERASIRDVLSHVSGLASHDHSYLPIDSPLDVIRRMRFLRPSFELRQQWSYSNQFFILTSELIRRYSGMSYDEYVQARIFKPLNMNQTTFSASKTSDTGKLTEGYNSHGRRMPYWFPDDRLQLAAGPMGIISNVVDLTEWVKVWLNGGRHTSSNETIIPPDIVEQITTPNAVMYKKPMDLGFSITGYAMGWARHSYYGYDVLWHFGGVPGFTTIVAFLPKENVGVVVLINASAKIKASYDVAYRAIADALGLKIDQEGTPASSMILNTQNYFAYGLGYSSSTQSPQPDRNSSELGPPLNVEDFVGTYTNNGYNTIRLCAPTSTSGDCPQVLKAFDRVDRVSPYDSDSNLYASFPGIWASHLRLTHLSDERTHTFRAQFPYLFPYGYGKNTTGFEMWEPGLSEAIIKFVVEGDGEGRKTFGFGMYRMSEDISERQRLGGLIQETADVWFVRE